MEKGQRVKIIGTNSIWDNKEGIVEDVLDGNTCTVFVNFIPSEHKRVRQDFKLENLEEMLDPLEEAYKNKETGEIGDVIKEFGDYVLFQNKEGKKSQVAFDNLEEIEEVNNPEVLHVQQAPSFAKDLDELDARGRTDEFLWILDDAGGSLGILRLKGLDEAIKCDRVEFETRSGNNKFNNPNKITVYALKKGKGSHNQFRAYFFRKGDTCVFVRGHIKTQDKNGSEEYKCIQDTIDYASK